MLMKFSGWMAFSTRKNLLTFGSGPCCIPDPGSRLWLC